MRCNVTHAPFKIDFAAAFCFVFLKARVGGLSTSKEPGRQQVGRFVRVTQIQKEPEQDVVVCPSGAKVRWGMISSRRQAWKIIWVIGAVGDAAFRQASSSIESDLGIIVPHGGGGGLTLSRSSRGAKESFLGPSKRGPARLLAG